MGDVSAISGQVDELISFKEENEEVLEGLLPDGSGGFISSTAEIGECSIGTLTVDTLNVTGGSGNNQQIFAAEISASIIKDSIFVGKGVSGSVNSDSLITYMKMLRITPVVTSKNYLNIKNLGVPSIDFYTERGSDNINSINFYKSNINYDKILSYDDKFKLSSRNDIEISSEKMIHLSSKNTIKLSLDLDTKLIELSNPTYISSNINSSSLDTGCLIVDGGIGVKKDVNIGGNLSVINNLNVEKNLNSENSYIKNNLSVENDCFINNTITIKGNLNIYNSSSDSINEISNKTIFTNEEDSHNKDTGSLIIDGGISVKKNICVGSDIYVKNDIECLSNLNVASKIGIGTMNPMSALHINSDSAIVIPVGDDNNRPNPALKGMLRFNNISGLEGYDGSNWSNFGGVRNSDGTTQIYVDSNDDIYFKSNDKINGVMSDGKFGIGNGFVDENYPSELIHIKGNLKLDGMLILSAEASAGAMVGSGSNDFDMLDDSIDITPETTVSNAFYNTEKYLIDYLVGHPGAPTLNNDNITNILYEMFFTKPQQYSFGFTDKLLPQLNNIHFEYKKSSSEVYTTITSDNININHVKFILDFSTNYIEDNIFYIYLNDNNIPSEFDFRIYYSNYKSNSDSANRDYNYLSVTNKIFLETGFPGVVTNLTTNEILEDSITVNYTKPIDHDLLNPDNQILPLIKNYKIIYNSISTYRNNNFIALDKDELTISGNITTNAPILYNISNLNPGHTYRINVKALNRISKIYSENSESIEISTLGPQPIPEYINTKTLTINNGNSILYNTRGSLLNSTQNELIVINDNISNNIVETNILNNIRLNYSINSIDTQDNIIISNFIINLNKLDTYNINIYGFNSTTLDNLSTNLQTIFSNEGDFNTETNKLGFYKVIDVKLKHINSIPRIEPYYFNIKQNVINDNNSYITNEIEYYVDNINSLAETLSLSINSINTNVSTKISGINVFLDNTIFNYSLTIRNLANYFVRTDYKFNDLYLSDINDNLFSNLYELKINDSNITFVPDLNSVTLPLNVDININGTISITSISEKYCEDLKLKSLAYNLYGINSQVIDNIHTEKILIDISSKETLDDINNNINYGNQVKSGIGNFPNFGINNNEFGDNYDHNDSILLTEELQLINGYFTSAQNNYLDYSNYFENNLDYSSIINNTDYRYVTFKYDINDITTSTDNSLNIIKIELIGINFNNIIENDIKFMVKIHNTDSLSNLNTIWISGNTPINGIGINLQNSSASNTNNNGIGGLSTSGIYKSTNTIKYIYLPQGSKGILYTRMGIRNDSNKRIKFIKVENV